MYNTLYTKKILLSTYYQIHIIKEQTKRMNHFQHFCPLLYSTLNRDTLNFPHTFCPYCNIVFFSFFRSPRYTTILQSYIWVQSVVFEISCLHSKWPTVGSGHIRIYGTAGQADVILSIIQYQSFEVGSNLSKGTEYSVRRSTNQPVSQSVSQSVSRSVNEVLFQDYNSCNNNCNNNGCDNCCNCNGCNSNCTENQVINEYK